MLRMTLRRYSATAPIFIAAACTIFYLKALQLFQFC